MRRWRRFLDRDRGSWSDDDNEGSEEDVWSSKRRLIAGGSSMAGVQKNRDGLANGSKNFAGWGKIFFLSWRREFIVGLFWELVPEAAARSVLECCEGVRSLASEFSSTGNRDVQSATGLPNTAALIP